MVKITRKTYVTCICVGDRVIFDIIMHDLILFSSIFLKKHVNTDHQIEYFQNVNENEKILSLFGSKNESKVKIA